MILEYLSGNALRKYPFNDTANMLSLSGFRLANDSFLDLQLSAPALTESFSAYLSNVTNNGSAIVLTFVLQSSSGSTLLTHSASYSYGSLSAYTTSTYADASLIVRIVPGPSIASLIANTSLNESFTAELCSSALVQPVPVVSSLSFYNQSELVLDTNTDVTIQGGSNTTFNLKNGSSNLDVIPGSGAGLYNPCTNALYIKSINNTGPDRDGNFLLNTDDCYTSTPQIHGLFIDNICTPRCTQSQLAAFAHYLNRVKNGASEVSGMAISLASELSTAVTAFATTPRNKIYAKIAYAEEKAPDPDFFFWSFAVAVFNPTTTHAVAGLTAILGTSLFSILGTSKWVAGGITTWQPQDGSFGETLTCSLDATIPCLGIGTWYFTIFGPKSTSTSTVTIAGDVGVVPVGPAIYSFVP